MMLQYQINQNGTSIVITNDDWDDKNENSTAIAQHYKLPVKYGIIDASGKKTTDDIISYFSQQDQKILKPLFPKQIPFKKNDALRINAEPLIMVLPVLHGGTKESFLFNEDINCDRGKIIKEQLNTGIFKQKYQNTDNVLDIRKYFIKHSHAQSNKIKKEYQHMMKIQKIPESYRNIPILQRHMHANWNYGIFLTENQYRKLLTEQIKDHSSAIRRDAKIINQFSFSQIAKPYTRSNQYTGGSKSVVNHIKSLRQTSIKPSIENQAVWR